MNTLVAIDHVIERNHSGRDNIASCAERESLGGLVGHYGTLEAYEAVTYTEDFPARREARVSAAGLGDIDVYVYDRYGGLVGYDNAENGLPTVTWKPIRSGEFLIKLVNCSDQPVEYALHTSA